MPNIKSIIKELVSSCQCLMPSYLEKFAYAHDLLWAEGAYKMCLYREDWDVVIKIDQLEDIGSCAREYERYLSAKQYLVDKILLLTEPTNYAFRSGQEVYLQTKADTTIEEYIENYPDVTSKAVEMKILSIKKIAKARQKMVYSYINPFWLEKCYSVYGNNFMKKFLKWQYKSQLCDLHNGNIGFRDGLPIILDYE